jgi:hypothetical protein
MKIILTEEQYKKITSEQILNKIKNFFTGDEKEVTSDTGCSTDTLKPSNWQDLYSKLVKKNMIKQGDKLLIVWGPTQKLYYTRDGKSVITSFSVSTGANGFGNTENDKKTPTGLIKVTRKIGGKDYEVMVGKQPTGVILGPNKDSGRVDNKTGEKHIAEVLTGILELSGLEDCNSNVFSRNIYFHGTNREKFLGTARSNGCIRVSNPAIKWLISNVDVGTKVYIQP